MNARRNNLVATAAVAISAGTTVFLLTFPTSGTDSDPPACYSSFDAHVACDWRLASLAALIALVVPLLAFWVSSKALAWVGFGLAVLGGVLVVALLLPTSVNSSDPPQCWSVFDYRVGCDTWPVLIAGVFAATAGVVGAGSGRAR